MARFFPLVMILLVLVGCLDKPAPTGKSAAAKDPKVAAAEDKISKTTPEGKAMIEKVRAMKPEVNEQVSGKTLKEIVDDYATNKGAYNITITGWEGSQKKPRTGEKDGRWKVVLHYLDYNKQPLAAEWEYNPDTNTLGPFETNNAPQFWSQPAADAKKGKK